MKNSKPNQKMSVKGGKVKKVLILTLVMLVSMVPVLFAAGDDVADRATAPHIDGAKFIIPDASNYHYDGPTSTPTLVDSIHTGPIHASGYVWGITYDWDRDCLWVSMWNSAYNYLYAIQKTSPCTKIDSVALGSGVPSYRLGLGYAGGDVLYMAGFDANIYQIDLSTGTGTTYRSLPWSSGEGLGFNVVDDAVYPGDWTADQWAWAQPAQSGSWNTVSLTNVSGLTGAFSGAMSPTWLFTCDEASSGTGHFYQHSLSSGVPNTTPDSVWDYDASQSQTSTADAAFDGQLVYILDQQSPDVIYIYDIGLPPPNDTARWDFETGLQGWTHTNGLPFPGGWDVEPSGLHSTYTPPNAQDSTLWIDSDAYGSGTADTALSPMIIPNPTTTNWLWYGLGYNYLGGDFVEVGLKYYDGSSWAVAPLATYNADTVTAKDSVDVSAYNTYNLIQVYFYYEAPGWDWYAAVDNVTINGQIGANHDVGTASIDEPSLNVMPNITVTPTATFKNYGDFQDTFDVYYTIDTNGAQFYTDTRNIILVPSAESTVTFNQFTTSSTTGFTYDITVYTALAGDGNIANDTLTQQTIVNPTFWETLADFPLGCSGNSEATINDGTYMMFGVHPSGQYSSDVYSYDIATDTWSTKTPNPYGCGAYGMAYGVNGKYYRIGGTDGWPTPLDRVDIYDPATDSWSAGATCPMANMDQIGGVYNDSLIFSIGGGNWSVTPHNNVYFYDTYTDAWTTATAFPGAGRGCEAGGVIDTFIIVAAGYDGSSTYRNDYILGHFSPSDPATITWGSPTTIPGGFTGRYRVSSGVDNYSKLLWVTCGQFSGGALGDIWSYDPYTDTWTNWNMPKTNPVGNITPVAVTTTAMGDVGVFVATGYNGSYITAHEVFHTGVGVAEKPGHATKPLTFGLGSAKPNPTHGYAGISYTTTKTGPVSLKIYDATGRLVRTLVDNPHMPAGAKTAYWNGKDNNHQSVAAGVYFYRLIAENKMLTKKMVVVK